MCVYLHANGSMLACVVKCFDGSVRVEKCCIKCSPICLRLEKVLSLG